LAALVLGAVQPGCGSPSAEDNAPVSIKIGSPNFQEGGEIPARFACHGKNMSPALSWQGAPANTKSFALILSDPDAPFRTFIHWVYYNLPSGTTQLPEGIPMDLPQLPDGSLQGMNSFDMLGYGGPCPPGGTHRYVFTIYALDEMLDLKPKASEKALQRAMQGHILAEGKLMGRYHK